MNITTNNRQSIITYLVAAKELNSFVKNNFSKKEREGLCIAPIIKDLHIENERIEKALYNFDKINVDKYIHKDMYLKGSINALNIYSQYVLIHIIGRSPNNGNRFRVEYISIPPLSYEKICDVDICKEKKDINAMDLIQAINNKKLVECDAKEYKDADTLYTASFAMLKAFADRYKK